MFSPRLVLHIGTEKTGTTSLQSFAFDHADRLHDKDGVLYPTNDIGSPFGHTKFTLLGYGNNKIDDLTIANDFTSPERRRVLREEWFRQFKNTLQNSAAHTVLLSSEFFQSRLTTEQELLRIKSLLQPLFSHIDILMYARPPLACAISLLSESIKNGSTKLSLAKPDNSYIRNICDHESSVKLWRKVFSESRIFVKPFHRSYLKNGCIVSDILDFCGSLTINPAEFLQPKNQSLTAESMYLLSCLNRSIPKIVNKKINADRKNLVEFVAKHFSSGTPYIPSRDEINAYHTAFLPSQQWISNEFWDGDDLPWQIDTDFSDRRRQIYLDRIHTISNDKFIESLITCFADAWTS
jgi:hypothetical protein